MIIFAFLSTFTRRCTHHRFGLCYIYNVVSRAKHAAKSASHFSTNRNQRPKDPIHMLIHSMQMAFVPS